ncbi:sulfotransferase family protein [Thalassomonas haliotis]|uniref:Sulfotransferase n=1 Tax=Thalassomonas haliotis TaxID=485448 RepID=A0ABY7VIC6_9GAMM|nr:sulfotransferase [Thalassomonas haliotis]WDE13278.1 sulfotransferase [Thalassomonas haliotis]
MSARLYNWQLPTDVRIPDFIICGAMKSGTTSIHAILNQHPDIYIPDDEVHFFDMDNLLQHPDFNHFDGKQWSVSSLARDPQQYYAWYRSRFSPAAQHQLLGEDSTTYLASEIAAQRISQQKRETKLIILLRQPSTRAYSQYWHLLRSGRATHSFEDTIRYNPHSILERSLYLTQLQNVYKHIPQEQVKVIVFEDFLADKQAVLMQLCTFLKADYRRLPADALGIHANSGRLPMFPAIELMKNRLFRDGGNQGYHQRFSCDLTAGNTRKITFSKLVNKAHRLVNPLVVKKAPKIHPQTKAFLDDYFYRELQGLNELLGRDILAKWFT